MENKEGKTYQKHHSFESFHSRRPPGVVEEQRLRATRLLEASGSLAGNETLQSALGQLRDGGDDFKITRFIAEEMETIDDRRMADYIFHRWRYDVFPKRRQLDGWPPYLQIEPAAPCNYKCVFCFQADPYFEGKKKGGFMPFDTYKRIVDEIEGRVEFISLASRGEPLLCADIDRMLEYSSGKFLNLKVNTNASALTERHAHALLSGGVKTIVFSADAADEETYARLRRGGDLKRVLKNVEMFQKIREDKYPGLKIISRVSGVMVEDKGQEMDRMRALWGGLVDQITFVKYNPWENVYDSGPKNIDAPCSDLWRRMFIWHDGVANPCDVDFKSTLSAGSVMEGGVSGLWMSKAYGSLRGAHLSNMRRNTEPCKRCSVL